jgi:hypothetical protein
MLRSATVDEDDGWSTDFSLSDEDMGETYLDHVEVSFPSTSNAMIIHGGVHFFRHDFFYFTRSHCDAVTLCWPTTPLWDRPRPAFGKEISSILFAWDAPDGGTSARHQVSAFFPFSFLSKGNCIYIFNFNSSGQLLVARGMGAIGVSGDGPGTHHQITL